jgi:trehalose synthase
MLQTLLAYARGAGVDARWLVIEGDPAFFAITKRIHNGLYGDRGDGGELGELERGHYEEVLKHNADELLALVRPGDVVLIHDPQPAGLAPAVKRTGSRVVWRCQVGTDTPNQWSERAWEFLRPYLAEVDAIVVSRAAFAPHWADPARVHVIPPSIDPFSAKNEPISGRNVRLTLSFVGLLDGGSVPPAVPFTRRDGSPGRRRSPDRDARLPVDCASHQGHRSRSSIGMAGCRARNRAASPPSPASAGWDHDRGDESDTPGACPDGR